MADQPTENVPNSTLSALVATLIPSLVVSTVYFSAFLLLRKSQRRFYAPRSYLGTLREEEMTEALPDGWFNWIGPFIKIADSSALKSQSLDAYLFLRFLRMTVIIMFIGALITWPILFPVYITGGSGSGQLDMLSMSNIDKSGSGKYRYYATTFAGWIFFSFILVLVTRESIFFINLRQAFLLSPTYASKISSRTVLFTSVPTKYRDETKLRQIYGSSVERVWLTKDTTSVDELVNERDKVALKLEAAEIELIKTANSERLKFNKKNKNKSASTNAETIAPEENVEAGSLSARWVPKKKRPMHKPGLLGLLGKEVDTIDWCRSRLKDLIPATLDAQNSYKKGDINKTGGVFVEFKTLADAQNASQTLTDHYAFQMAPRFIGIKPEEVIWSSLKTSWPQRLIRRLNISTLLVALMIIWTIPSGFVGFISDANYLMEIPKLSWLKLIPDAITGIITGLLPVVAIEILMSLALIVIRALAMRAGVLSLSQAELFTQQFYFIFDVVQFFLVITVAPAVIGYYYGDNEEMSENFGTLATQIANASNFYISYFVLLGLPIAANVISQLTDFIIFSLVFKLSAKTPRSLYENSTHLSPISLCSKLAGFNSTAVLGITFSCIAPLTLGFSTICTALFYWAYRYNILYVSYSSIDTKGLLYPCALQQLLTGVYLAEICLIVLLVIYDAIVPSILMSMFLIFTSLYHRCLNAALEPLLQNLPKTLLASEETIQAERIATESENNGDSNENISENPTDSRENINPSLLAKFIAPHIYDNYKTLRQMISRHMISHTGLDLNNLYEASVADKAYLPPSVKSEPPLLWIPKDNIGISAEEIAETGKIISITDEGASISDENKIIWDPEGSRPPIWRPRIFY